MGTPEPNDPRFKIVGVTKAAAATSQLHTAIDLWFGEGDPVSIHTLSVAAQDCFHTLSSMTGRPSLTEQWQKSMSNSKRKAVREAQNFFKHGARFPKRRLNLFPYYAELMIFDSVLSFEHLYKTLTPLMESFMLRFVSLYPEHLREGVKLSTLFGDIGLEVDEIAPLGRPDFLARVLPAIESIQGKTRE